MVRRSSSSLARCLALVASSTRGGQLLDRSQRRLQRRFLGSGGLAQTVDLIDQRLAHPLGPGDPLIDGGEIVPQRARPLFESVDLDAAFQQAALGGAQFVDLLAQLGAGLVEDLVGHFDASAHRVNGVAERRVFRTGALDMIEMLGAQAGVGRLLLDERLLQGGEPMLALLEQRFTIGDAPAGGLQTGRKILRGVAQRGVLLRQQRALIGGHLERQFEAGKALVLARKFVLQAANLVREGDRAARLDVDLALQLLPGGGVVAQPDLRLAQRGVDALRALLDFAIFAQEGVFRLGEDIAFGERRGVTDAQTFVQLFKKSELGPGLLQTRLGRLEIGQQFRHRRQQAVELAAHLLQMLEPVFDLLDLGAQRLVLHADRLKRSVRRYRGGAKLAAPMRATAPRRPAGRSAG